VSNPVCKLPKFVPELSDLSMALVFAGSASFGRGGLQVRILLLILLAACYTFVFFNRSVLGRCLETITKNLLLR
jgi:hypothetical protein